MFAAQIIHDPESAVAKTLEQAILKLDALNKMGNARARWGHNISNSCKDLPEEFHHDFIRYLANPGGYEQTSNLNQELEDMVLKELPPEASTTIPEELEQTYTVTKKGNEYEILVENVKPGSDDDEHDEKNPL